jgi:hypothetical protein
MSIPLCHYCSRPINIGIPLVLWDGETYCSPCVDAVDPGLTEYARTHSELIETLTAENLQRWRILAFPLGIRGTLGCFGTLFMALALFAIFAIARGETPGCCCGFCFLGFSLFVWALAVFIAEDDFYVAIESLPRTVRISDGELVVETNHELLSITLARCDWFPSNTDLLRETVFLPRSPAIIVYHPKSGYLAIGLTPEMYRVWYAFLTLSGIRNRGRFPWGRLLLGWLVGLPTGFGLGIGLGRFLKNVTGDDLLPLAFGLLGTLDGFCIPIFIVLTRWFGEVGAKQMGNRWKSAGRFALAFGMLGLFVAGGRGVGLGRLPGITAIMVNTCIGFLVGWWCGQSTAPPEPTKT